MKHFLKTLPGALFDAIKRQGDPKSILILNPGKNKPPLVSLNDFPHASVEAFDTDLAATLYSIDQFGDGVRYHFENPAKQYNLVMGIAILHSNPKLNIPQMVSYAKKGGLVGVIDYDMKNIKSSADFFDRFGYLDEEKKEVELIGKDNAFLLHTSFGLDDCIKGMNDCGVRDMEIWGNISSIWYKGKKPTKHFIYVGQKI